MTIDELDRDGRGRVKWKEWAESAAVGDQLVIICFDNEEANKFRQSAVTSIRAYGVYIESKVEGKVATITKINRKPVTK